METTQENRRKGKMEELIRRVAAMFIEIEATSNPLISVTRVMVDDRMKKADIFVSVLPNNKETDVVNFLHRKRPEFREYLQKNMRSRVVPHIDFLIDSGEKNRQRIEELSHEK
ncbi:MAG TPA: ribosome-binding factor A [Candidatus Paceibacterota bacterium]|nr:ribosome-binding factor A [Candidatus Paceibacterota bacterium]